MSPIDVDIKVPALEKLLDYSASGIGSIAGPMLASWKARQKVKAKKILVQGEADALQIVVDAQVAARKKLTNSGIEVQGELKISEKIEQRLLFQEEKRQRNIESVVKLAAENLENEYVPNKEPDHDFTARFFADVQDVSSEDLQLLWAKVLSGEVKRPGSTSIHTLSILKNLDGNTAKLFQKLCSACIKTSAKLGDEICIIDARMPSLGKNAGSNALTKYGFPFQKLTLLNEHGLIISDYNSWISYTPFFVNKGKSTPFFFPFEFQGQQWILTPKSPCDTSKEFRVSGVALTRAGVELSRTVVLDIMEQYTQDLISFLESKDLNMIRTSSKSTL